LHDVEDTPRCYIRCRRITSVQPEALGISRRDGVSREQNAVVVEPGERTAGGA
jgi:hypothetical protein